MPIASGGVQTEVHKHAQPRAGRKQSHAQALRTYKIAVATFTATTSHNPRAESYWFDEGTGKVFCLVEAPSREIAIAVHQEVHGLLAEELIEVKEGS